MGTSCCSKSPKVQDLPAEPIPKSSRRQLDQSHELSDQQPDEQEPKLLFTDAEIQKEITRDASKLEVSRIDRQYMTEVKQCRSNRTQVMSPLIYDDSPADFRARCSATRFESNTLSPVSCDPFYTAQFPVGCGQGIFSSRLGSGRLSPSDSNTLQPSTPGASSRVIRKRYTNEMSARNTPAQLTRLDSNTLQPSTPGASSRVVRKRYTNEMSSRNTAAQLAKKVSDQPQSTCYSTGGSSSGPNSMAGSSTHLLQVSKNLQQKREAIRSRKERLVTEINPHIPSLVDSIGDYQQPFLRPQLLRENRNELQPRAMLVKCKSQPPQECLPEQRLVVRKPSIQPNAHKGENLMRKIFERRKSHCPEMTALM